MPVMVLFVLRLVYKRESSLHVVMKMQGLPDRQEPKALSHVTLMYHTIDVIDPCLPWSCLFACVWADA